VGVDIDPEAIRQARTHFGGDGVEFLVDDCEQLSQTPGPFDLICSFENIEHLRHPERFLDAAGRRLAPDGALLISTPDRASTPPFVNGRPKNKFHMREWRGDEFYTLLCKYFAVVIMYAHVETAALRSRAAALSALRRVLRWHNPVAAFFLRRRPFRLRRYQQSWKDLADLAAPSISDYPIVALPIATLFGAPVFHVAICRRPSSLIE
jgi:SAM-dependent methyltransferase